MPNSPFLVLKKHKVFQCLTDEECESLQWEHDYYVARKGEYFYFGRECVESLYFMKSGWVKLGTHNEEGEEVIIEIIQQHDIFGQLDLKRQLQKKEFARALTDDVIVCIFSTKRFYELTQRYPELALTFSVALNQKVLTLENRISDLLHKRVEDRLIAFLVYLTQKLAVARDGDSYRLRKQLTHEDIAHMIGSTRQTVTTLLHNLQENHLITINKDYFIINSLAALQERLTASAIPETSSSSVPSDKKR